MSSEADSRQGAPRISFRQRLAYGIGAVGDMIGFHGPLNLAVPIFTLYLGVNPALVGAVVAITRVWDAVSDPLMGKISDQTRSRWGRRKPYIVLGAITGGASLTLMWQVPAGLSEVGNAAFLCATLLLFYTAFTVFTVPYHALGYELTDDHHERTSVMAHRIFFNVIGNVAVGWLFAVAKAPIFGDPIKGAKWAGAMAGIVFALTCLVPGILVPERRTIRAVEAEPFWASLKATIRNVEFRVLLALTTLILVTSSMIFSSFLIYINTYYTFRGNVEKAAVLQGIITTCFALSNAASLPLIARISRRIGKKEILKWAFSVQAVAGVATWFMITPEAPYLQLVALVFHQFGFITFFVMLHSMTADVCDFDARRGGQRREGMFGAAITWVQKMAVAASVLLSGSVLVALGFDSTPGAAQPESVVFGMRAVFAAVLTGQALICLVILRFYRLDERKLHELTLESGTSY